MINNNLPQIKCITVSWSDSETGCIDGCLTVSVLILIEIWLSWKLLVLLFTLACECQYRSFSKQTFWLVKVAGRAQMAQITLIMCSNKPTYTRPATDSNVPLINLINYTCAWQVKMSEIQLRSVAVLCLKHNSVTVINISIDV